MRGSAIRKLPPGCRGPLYRRLADMIFAEIEQGLLKPGGNLPTVRELAGEMKLSTGTVKHAYDELERLGVIEKVQGRGTFVRNRSDEAAQGKKDRAMLLIDGLLDDMQNLGFSRRETQIFFDLKMREREDRPRQARVVVVECNPEALYVISNQIARIRGADVESSLLDDFSNAPALMDADPDIIVTTANHYETVAQAAANEDRVSRVALSPSRTTVAKLAKAESGGRVGIMAVSDRFAWIIGTVCAELAPDGSAIPHKLFGKDCAGDFLNALDTVILPDYYTRLCSQSDLTAIRAFQEAGGDVVEFTYHIDEGSLMYLEQRIERVLASKELQ